jgi:uncharacterized spore protein YtfJ
MTMVETVPRDQAVMEVLQRVAGNATVRAVFGEPITTDGVTVVPVARVSSGAGGGTGTDPQKHESQGTGGGLGLSARPVGAYVIREGKVSWRPAVDVNRVVLGAQIVAVVGILTIRALLRRRGK